MVHCTDKTGVHKTLSSPASQSSRVYNFSWLLKLSWTEDRITYHFSHREVSGWMRARSVLPVQLVAKHLSKNWQFCLRQSGSEWDSGEDGASQRRPYSQDSSETHIDCLPGCTCVQPNPRTAFATFVCRYLHSLADLTPEGTKPDGGCGISFHTQTHTSDIYRCKLNSIIKIFGLWTHNSLSSQVSIVRCPIYRSLKWKQTEYFNAPDIGLLSTETLEGLNIFIHVTVGLVIPEHHPPVDGPGRDCDLL